MTTTQTTQSTSRPFAARYAGRCACGRPIVPGQTVVMAGGKARHADCGAASATTTARSSAPARRSRGTWTGCSCGSVEEYERAGDCASCRHDRY